MASASLFVRGPSSSSAAPPVASSSGSSSSPRFPSSSSSLPSFLFGSASFSQPSLPDGHRQSLLLRATTSEIPASSNGYGSLLRPPLRKQYNPSTEFRNTKESGLKKWLRRGRRSGFNDDDQFSEPLGDLTSTTTERRFRRWSFSHNRPLARRSSGRTPASSGIGVSMIHSTSSLLDGRRFEAAMGDTLHGRGVDDGKKKKKKGLVRQRDPTTKVQPPSAVTSNRSARSSSFSEDEYSRNDQEDDADDGSPSRSSATSPIDAALTKIGNRRRILEQRLNSGVIELQMASADADEAASSGSRSASRSAGGLGWMLMLRSGSGSASSDVKPSRALLTSGTGAQGRDRDEENDGMIGDVYASDRRLSRPRLSRLRRIQAAQEGLMLDDGEAADDEEKEDEEDLRVLQSDESFKWANDNYNRTQRSVDVWSFVLTFRAWLWFIDTKWTYAGGFTDEKQSRRRRSLASWVRETILQLGPTFIKLGQLSSSRSDLLPVEFLEELSELQDRVPAFTAEKAVTIIERELGQPINSLFAKFYSKPLAAASLGQVHRASLRTGEEVVVKVQRPGLKQLFDIDLENMRIIAEFFQSSETLGGPTRDWVGIYEECSNILYQEIDYINEGRNADRFRNDFRNTKWVKVPQVYWEYTSRQVLTLEYVPGTKVNDLEELDRRNLSRKALSKIAIEAYLIQILKTGFFHADPHPGNVAVSADGSLIYYDFGMMGDIKSFTREKLLDIFYAVYEKNASKVMAALIDLGALVPTADSLTVRRSIQFFLDNLMEQRPDEDSTIAAIGEDLFSIAVDQPFRFPATFTFVLRAFSTLEGIGKTLDPEFSFAEVAAPYAEELLQLKNGNNRDFVLQQLQKQAFQTRDDAVMMPNRVKRMDDIISALEKGDLKLRVRVLEAERTARRAGVMQMITLNTVIAATFLNVGSTLYFNGLTGPANGSFATAGLFSFLIYRGYRRIQKLDAFERKVK